MVIPVTLDAATQAAIDAARAAGDNTVVAVPRIDGAYGPVGTTALVEKVGRLPTGEPAAVIRGLYRAHLGSGVSGPGAALWVEITPFAEPAPAGKARELAREYKTLVTSLLQRRGAWQVRDAALREVGKLERASEQAPEAGWIRTWLDTVLELPWNTRTEDNTDLTAARAVLDADHAGLDDVKDRILEYLAVRNRRAARNLQVVGGRGSGAVLALVGPPGVGKTSLGESVARALGRRFTRVSLGGVRDEAEIRGHRRTYVGALPGRIVR